MSAEHGTYFIPEPSKWPFIAMLSVLSMLFGTALTIHGMGAGPVFAGGGLLLLLFLFYGWFGDVIDESRQGKYDNQVDRSMRIGMMWFIASEVFFFLAFFGSLFYIRMFALPWISGGGYLGSTNEYLYQGFQAVWPTSGPQNVEFTPMGALGLPLINTILLLSSGVTVTWAHHALKKGNRKHLIWGLAATVLLGFTFVSCQAYEYIHAYSELNLKLTSGVYGSTFFLLTGFHGFHVILGATMLTVILVRSIKGHFTPEKHFGFEAVAWYWHFVDVVWLGLYAFVYWM